VVSRNLPGSCGSDSVVLKSDSVSSAVTRVSRGTRSAMLTTVDTVKGGDHGFQSMTSLRKVLPYERLRRSVQTFVMTDLVTIDVTQSLSDAILLQCITPVLELRITGEKELLSADLE